MAADLPGLSGAARSAPEQPVPAAGARPAGAAARVASSGPSAVALTRGSGGSSGRPGVAGDSGSGGTEDSPGTSGGQDGSRGSSSGGRGRKPTSGRNGSAGSSGQDDNPFAPPPEGRPDQPWRPRHPEGAGPHGRHPEDQGDRPAWGGQWSNHQPGRSPEGFGNRPGGDNRQQHPQGPGGPGGLRWDPSDVSQRRARYSLLAGLWGFFFALLGVSEVALLLGALALYWAISSLRDKAGKERDAKGEEAARLTAVVHTSRPGPLDTAPGRARAAAGVAHPGIDPAGRQGRPPQATAAITGLVTACLALVYVASVYAMQLAYHDYYTCLNDALTHAGQVACNSHLPKSLVPLYGIKN